MAGALAGQIFAADSAWTTSAPAALAQAKKDHKLVLLDFTGSDWCPPCKRLEAEILSQPRFLDYAKTNLVLVQVDFPAQKKQSAALREANNELQEKYNVQGYPTLLLLKPDGTVIWNHVGYLEGGPSALVEQVEAIKAKVFLSNPAHLP